MLYHATNCGSAGHIESRPCIENSVPLFRWDKCTSFCERGRDSSPAPVKTTISNGYAHMTKVGHVGAGDVIWGHHTPPLRSSFGRCDTHSGEELISEQPTHSRSQHPLRLLHYRTLPIMSESWSNASTTGSNSGFTQGPGGGTHSEGFNQGQGRGGAYDELQSSQSDGMGGGRGAMGSGVAGGHSGNTQSTGEKQDWLDKGLESLGKKAGFTVSDKNADMAGDFINKEVKDKAGRNLPGVY